MSGRNAPRSKNGCSTCRRRKVKCGEERPVCQRCSSLHIPCEWGVPVKRGHAVQMRNLQPARPRLAQHHEEINLDYSDLAMLWQSFSSSSSSPAPGQPDSFLPSAWPVFPPSPFPTPLYPSITAPEVACANSLVLSKQDQNYFQYFPSSSIVFYYMKAWQWSSFCYLYQGPATTSKVIMRMILALAASDMHRNGFGAPSPGRPTAEDHARNHYGLAVKEFRQMLETPRRHVSHIELEMIFVTMFLMIMYEWQFGNHVRHLQLHLQGVRSLLETHPELFQDRDVNNVFSLMDAEEPDEVVPKISFVPVQMLLWILYVFPFPPFAASFAEIARYVDIGAQPMGLTESLYDYVLNSGNSALQPDHLYQCARLWGRCFWGGQYPDQEVMDDNENYRGLELIHIGMVLRHVVWRVAIGNPIVPGMTSDSLFQEMMSIRNRYSDLFITAKLARGFSSYRTINTIHMGVANFYAQVLFHRRVFSVHHPPSALHRQALGHILEIARRQYSWDPRLLRRLHWPLLMAVIETDDPPQREWVRQRLGELRDYHSEYTWANRVADEVLAEQERSGVSVNLFEFLGIHVQ